MRIFKMENGKLTNIKQNGFSNFSNYKKILPYNNNPKINSRNPIITKFHLKRNNYLDKTVTNIKKKLLSKNLSFPIVYSNDFTLKPKIDEKLPLKNYINERKSHKNLIKKFLKYSERTLLRNNSFSNSKLSQFDDALSSKKSIKIQNENKTFLNENNNEINKLYFMINSNKKQRLNSNYYNLLEANINKKENNNDDECEKIKDQRYNNIIDKYVSNNKIINLKFLNNVSKIVKSNRFELNLKYIRNVYKDNNLMNEKENKSERINTKNFMIKKLEKNYSYQSFKEIESSENIIEKSNKNLILPFVNSEEREKSNKLATILNSLNDKNELKKYRYYKLEKTILREVNMYYIKNKYNSLKEFFNDLVQNKKDYLTIDEIEYFLNKRVKLSIPMTREEIIKIFFTKARFDHFDYYDFKNFFRIFKQNHQKENSKETIPILKSELIFLEKIIIFKIIDSKEILLNKLENQKDIKTLRENIDDFVLNFDEFYILMKNNLKIYKNKYFDIVIRKIFIENIESGKNKIDFLKFLNKIEKLRKAMEYDNINNISDIQNKFGKINRDNFLKRINLSNSDINISQKNQILEKEEDLNSTERKITNYIKIDKNTNGSITNIEELNFLNSFKNLNILNEDIENKKNKNSDIINII